MVTKRVTIAVFVVAAVAAALTAFAVADSTQSEDAAGVGSINDSYAFDVKDKKRLMGYGMRSLSASRWRP